MNISNMVAASLLQLKKRRWGKLSTPRQVVTASKYCESSDDDYE